MNKRYLQLGHWSFLVGFLFLFPLESGAQKNSLVKIFADKSAGYGVAFGGTDKIVTSLHIVAGKTAIVVEWQGKKADAQIEKILKTSDLALLKLKTPLGVPALTLYSGEPPWDSDVNFWEIPINTTTVVAKTTVLEERTSLAKISPRVADNPTGLSKALCVDGSQYYPGMTTEVINFQEPNIRKSHSGSPITYGGKIIGLVDGGAKLVDGKPCVWAIQGADFNKLLTQGTAPVATMKPCEAPGVLNKYMYSGTRSDNPMLSPEEVEKAKEFENALSSTVSFTDVCENELTLNAEYTVSFGEVFESLFEEDAQNILDLFSDESEFDANLRLSLDNLNNQTMDVYQENITGVSLVIPSEYHFTAAQNGFGRYITISSPLGATMFSVYISHSDTPEEAEKEMARFKAMCVNGGQPMKPAANDIKDFRCDSSNPYYKESVENASLDQNGMLKSEFFATMTINRTDFVGATVSVSDWNTMWNNPDERLFFYLMEISAILADFTIY